jgi:hypothetical protein
VCVCWGACVVGSRVAAVVRERGEEGCDRRERSWEVACVCLPYLWIVLCARTYGGGYLSCHQYFQIRKVSSEYSDRTEKHRDTKTEEKHMGNSGVRKKRV